jgi:hypothetical protein
MRYGLPLLSPVDDAGRFTEEAGTEFAGLAVLGEGNGAVIDALRDCGALLKVPCLSVCLSVLRPCWVGGLATSARLGRGHATDACITEANGMHLVLFGMLSRTLGHYVAAMHRILVSAMVACQHGKEHGNTFGCIACPGGGICALVRIRLEIEAAHHFPRDQPVVCLGGGL